MLMLVSAFLAGCAFILVFELFVLFRWFRGLPRQDPTLIPQQKPVQNPKDIAEFCGVDGATESESCMFLNLIFQFLWKEWRDSPKTRNFFIKKMNLEFKEMLLNKAAGRLMEQITVKDYFLGESLPLFKNVTVMKIDSRSPSQVPREIDLALDVEYSGGFIISLDVDLIFRKSASLTVKLNSLKGRLRLQFTRNPCTHWSFSFYDDPVMDIKVESNFQGKNLPKLTTFIRNQIRRSIRNKHTLPRYKVRYKPFFIQEKPKDGKNEVYVHNSLITAGKLDVEIVECTRLPQLPKGSHIYCTLSLDSLPWKEDMPMRRSLWPVHEVFIRRAPSGIIGLSVHQDFETIDEEKREMVLIESVKPNSPASQVDIQRGDILVSVNNVDILTIKQALRLLKMAGKKFTVKVQRPPAKQNRENNSEGPHQDIANGSHMPMSTDTEIMNTTTNSTNTRRNETPLTNGVEDSFDYNSVVLDNEDSETEDFVNIVVHEIVKELSEEDDETTKQIIDEVNLIHKESTKDSLLDVSDECISTESFSSTPSTSRIGTNENTSSINESIIANGSLPSGIKSSRKSFSSRLRKRFTRNSKKSSQSDNISINSIESTSKTTSNSSTTLIKTPESKKKYKKVKLIEDRESVSNCTLSRAIKEPLGVNNDDSFSHGSTENEWDNISQQHIEIEDGIWNNDDEKELAGQKTSILPANQEPVWNEIFVFDVEKEHKFLNICVWGKCVDTANSDLLIGYVSIPLMELAMECLSTTSRKNIQTFFLATTAAKSNISRTYVRVMLPGMNVDCCNGDITLAYRYQSAIPECDLLTEEMKLINEQVKRKDESDAIITNGNILPQNQEELQLKQHNFIGKEFYFPTRCDYCQNKVWRKVAFECRVCAMVSHKRCISNAQNNTYCTPNGVRAKPPIWQTNELPRVSETDTDVDGRLGNFSPTRTYPLNVPDELDLRPGIKNSNVKSKLILRKTSRNLIRPVGDSIYQMQHNPPNEEISEEFVNDSIATAAVTAKEAGRELFASLDETDREKDIQKKVEQLQYEIQLENEKEADLRRLLNETKDDDTETKQKIRSLILKSEERCQGLRLLMIQYCSALEECFALDEPKQCDL